MMVTVCVCAGVVSILHILLLIFSVQVCVLQNQILHSHYL